MADVAATLSTADQEEVLFVRTGDHLCLSCVPAAGGGHKRMALRAMAFGNRVCFLEEISQDVVCPDITSCVYVLEQAMSIRALQERFNQEAKDAGTAPTNQPTPSNSINSATHITSQAHSLKTLLYGHAVVLRHLSSTLYLSCLSTSTSNDKLAFDVGLKDGSEGESVWFTVHPGSKQRAEGEKVRFNDDIILVSVFSERYLHAYVEAKDIGHVNASFRQQIWSLTPVSSGASLTKQPGFLFGTNIIRLFHANMDQCICYTYGDQSDDSSRSLFIRGAPNAMQACSLWRIEPFKIKWHGGFVDFGDRFRLQHVATGVFLNVFLDEQETVQVNTVPHENATTDGVVFEFSMSKEKTLDEPNDQEGFGNPSIKCGETMVFIRHCATGLWISYDTFEITVKGVGKVEEKRLGVSEEGHMDDCFKLVKAQNEESRSAVIIKICSSTLKGYKRMDFVQAYTGDVINSLLDKIDVVEQLLRGLKAYFKHPDESVPHENRQKLLKALRRRQEISQEEGMINVLISTINFVSEKFDKDLVLDVTDGRIEKVTDELYSVLAAMIAGNRNNCKHFAQGGRLNWLIDKLLSQNTSTGVLEVIDNVLVESPEVLNMITEYHIMAIIGLLDSNGRDPKVLDVLGSLCRNKDVAVRTNQSLICDGVLARQDLLLKTILVDQVVSMRPNISVRRQQGATMFHKWYFEIMVDHVEKLSHQTPLLRVGWALTDSHCAPAIGHSMRCIGAGDDIYSWAFDGLNIWHAGRSVNNASSRILCKGDIVGCGIDLVSQTMTFVLNGSPMQVLVKGFQTKGTIFYPIVTMSAKVSCRFLLGEKHGVQHFPPANDSSPLVDTLIPGQRVVIERCFSAGDYNRSVLTGESALPVCASYRPTLVDTNMAVLPSHLNRLHRQVVENMHDMWCMNKISTGHRFSEYLDDIDQTDPSICSFEALPDHVKSKQLTKIIETLKTIIALKYHIHGDPQHDERRVRFIKLPNSYIQFNQYKPQPLDTSGIVLSNKLVALIEALAENAHNTWIVNKIEQGWTYSSKENAVKMRSPHMLPYNIVEESIRTLNRNAAADFLRVLHALGFYLEPFGDHDDLTNHDSVSDRRSLTNRLYRVEKQLAVTSGKWYFELEISTSGDIRAGWIKANAPATIFSTAIGTNRWAYMYGGSPPRKYYTQTEPFGKPWKPGDVVGFMIDLHDKTVSFSLNGEVQHDNLGSDAAFENIDIDNAYIPVVMLATRQRVKFNFGHDVHSLKYFTMCGLQEGYEPFCVNMARPVTFWYSNRTPRFQTINSDNELVEVHRVGPSRLNPPLMKILSKSSTPFRSSLTLRLSLPVKCYEILQTRESYVRTREDAMQKFHPNERFKEALLTRVEGLASGNLSTLARTIISHEMTTVDDDEPSTRQDDPAARKSEHKKKKIFNKLTKDKEKVRFKAGEAMFKNNGKAAINAKRLSRSDETGKTDTCLSLQMMRNILLDLHEYCYAIRVFPGQDISKVYIGWALSMYNPVEFSPRGEKEVECNVMCITEEHTIMSSVDFRSYHMMNAQELIEGVLVQKSSIGKVNASILVCTTIDVSSGTLSFAVDGVDCSAVFRVDPGSRLYPIVHVKPTCKEPIQFELGRYKKALPLSAACFSSFKKDPEPRCPLRMQVQLLENLHWERLPKKLIKAHTLKLGEIRGWSILCDEPVQTEAIYIAEEDYNVDILNLSEHPTDLSFCANQLNLFTAICAQSNCRTAHKLRYLVDQRQLIHCLLDKNMPGLLRVSFHELLFAMYLHPDFAAKQATSREHIIPLSMKLKQHKLLHFKFPSSSIYPKVECLATVRLNFISDEKLSDKYKELLLPPYFDLVRLKEHTFTTLAWLARPYATSYRDPIGGSLSTHIVPLLKIIEHLLVMGLMTDNEIEHLIQMMDSTHVGISSNHIGYYQGLIHEDLDEPIQLHLCKIAEILFDLYIQLGIENAISFSNDFVSSIQLDQKHRYTMLKESNLPPVMMAKKTREFRTPAKEQMQAMVRSKSTVDAAGLEVDVRHDIRAVLENFHRNFLVMLDKKLEEPKPEDFAVDDTDDGTAVIIEKFFLWLITSMQSTPKELPETDEKSGFFATIVRVLIKWATKAEFKDPSLIRAIFGMLFRHFQSTVELDDALSRTYVVKESSMDDIKSLLRDVSILRCLLKVQMGTHEENLLIDCLNNTIDNKVFFQHPDLIRGLAIHETVMAIMVDQLNKQKQEQGQNPGDSTYNYSRSPSQTDKATLVATCCKLLSYYCRTSSMNQRAMFEHLGFLLDNSSMLLSRPSLRGSCPLDVACASLMDNNELSLALREGHLERIASYLSRCGTTRNEELTALGYPDIGWDPVEGERFLDFLKFCVWVNGDTVEENADLVIRLLIRRPDCLGPALRGEGGGLFFAILEGMQLSLSNYLQYNPSDMDVRYEYDLLVNDPAIAIDVPYQSAMSLLKDMNEDYIDLGGAELTFYCTLVELMGMCAPSDEAVKMGKPSALKARSILRSLVSLSDLQGVLAIPFCVGKGSEDWSQWQPGLLPSHKMSIMFFLERVYSVPDQKIFFQILEEAFIPDIRCAILMDKATSGDSDFALALNRYLCNSVMSGLIQNSKYFADSEKYSDIIDMTLKMTYRYSKCSALTRVQRDCVMDFLVIFTSYLSPMYMNKLFGTMMNDIPSLSDSVLVTLKVLSAWYERLRRYYGSNAASQKEHLITIMLFQKIFDALSNRAYDPDLFGRALPCLTAIACSLSPDCTLIVNDLVMDDVADEIDDIYVPTIMTPSCIHPDLSPIIPSLAETFHDNWAHRLIEDGWVHGAMLQKKAHIHPDLIPYEIISREKRQQEENRITNALYAITVNGYEIEKFDAGTIRTPAARLPKLSTQITKGGCTITLYQPKAFDLNSLTITDDMKRLALLIARDAHETWVGEYMKTNKINAFDSQVAHVRCIPFALLTNKEQQESKSFYMQFLQLLISRGFRITEKVEKQEEQTSPDGLAENTLTSTYQRFDDGLSKEENTMDSRFASNFLSKLLSYVDKAANNMELYKESSAFSKFEKSVGKSEDIKFFTKVILPLLEQYFHAHRAYFITKPSSFGHGSYASIKAKEMVCSLFCKLALLLRHKLGAFGPDINVCTRCLQVLVRSVDISSVMKNSAEIVRASLLPYFNTCADDLIQTVVNLSNGLYSHLNGTLTRGSCSLLYLHMSALPVLSAMLDHLGKYEFGNDLFVNEIAVAGFKILNAAWTIGAHGDQILYRNWVQDELDRHRPLIGECLGSLASCFPVAFFEPELFSVNENSRDLATLSPEANDIMQQVQRNIPSLDSLLSELQRFVTTSGGRYEQAPHIIEVVIPTMCSYLARWYSHVSSKENLRVKKLTNVTGEHSDTVMRCVLQLIGLNIDRKEAQWMKRIALDTLPIVSMCSDQLLETDFCMVADAIRFAAQEMINKETDAKHIRVSDPTERESLESCLIMEFDRLIRVVYAFYPLLMKYTDLQRGSWLRNDNPNAQYLYNTVADVFNMWGSSKLFKREELNYVAQNEVDTTTMLVQKLVNILVPVSKSSKFTGKHKRLKKRLEKGKFSSLIVACIKRLLPIGLNMYGGPEQELIQLAKDRMVQLKISEGDNMDPNGDETLVLTLKADHEELIDKFLRVAIKAQMEGQDVRKGLSWQSNLYRRMKTKKAPCDMSNTTKVIAWIMNMSKVLYGLHLVDHPPQRKKGAWRKLISSQRKKAVMACFRMAPLHSIPRHRAINLFIFGYRQYWLGHDSEEASSELVEKLCSGVEESQTNELATSTTDLQSYDPLTQFIECLNRAATMENRTILLEADQLYLDYAKLMSESIGIEETDEDKEIQCDAEVKSIEEQEMEKQTLMMEQNRLADRGSAETVLHYISACKGQLNEMLKRTLGLGISLLHGGNKKVQKMMLKHLKETRDGGFFTSLAILMSKCTVLDLDIFERTLKAESLGAYNEGATISDGNLSDAEFTCSLFRFLQLLCEGHFQDFQNFLRSQLGNNTSVNIVICTVDYLLRLQESMMDFYWHFSGKDSMDATGKECFCRAITVAKQVLNTLTEYIQGPCVLNQLALANSRLWDAMSGFLFLFAHLQNKLSKDPKQIELMRELMKLQKDMIIMLLSMLEGNVLNGPIGKQMVDTIIETQPNVEMILQFFDIFLKMKGITTSEAFLEFDANKDGFISPKEFKQAMENQKMYTDEEIDYILMCVDANQDGKIDFIEFTERFHNPAKDIGFNMAVLLTNLSEHMPHDIRLQRLMEKAKSFLSYFEKSLGRIEIMGSSGRIERVYFEIKESNSEQWNKPQIKDSKKQFLNSIVNETDDKEKLEGFVNFCEDAIFEMQHAAEIGGEDEDTVQIATAMRLKDSSQQHSIAQRIKIVIMLILYIINPKSIFRVFKYLKCHTVKEHGQIAWRHTVDISKNLMYMMLYVSRVFGYCIWQLMVEEDKDITSTGMAQARSHQNDPSVGDIAFYDSPEVGQTFSAFGWSSSSENNEIGSPQTEIPATDTEGRGNVNLMLQRIQAKSPDTRSMRNKVDKPITEDKEIEKSSPDNPSNVEKRFKSFLALNFYKLKYLALVMAFLINFFVLSYKVVPIGMNGNESLIGVNEPPEQILIDPDHGYLVYLLRSVAFIHSCVSFSMLVAYYVLKVPLVIFRREKEICRKLEFDGMWIVEQPSENGIKNNWDKLVLSTVSFPSSFWNKFVKKKVKNKYLDQFDRKDLNLLLGLDEGETGLQQVPHTGWYNTFVHIDWKYNVWKWGVILTDRSFLYLLWYFIFSVLGNHNYFFFASHLLDIAVSIKTLSTIIVSITQNGRQLLLTITLMTVVVYVYSAIAFNFFRKFYKSDDDGETRDICTNMFQCFVFHVYHGIRAGGGIGDELESPSGDPLEFHRIFFDLTFFFFVIIILLAIIQGLIIDAFGELREQLESVKETLESKCFICGIGQDYFNKEPHGFEIHTTKEHDFAAYMFFLMHLINKPDTEHTGQESYVWDQYQNRKWDFFPVGDCFRKQYESTLKPT